MPHGHTPPDATTYPTNNLLAIIDDGAEADRAAEALKAAGFAPSDIVVFHGPEALAEIQSRETPITRLRNVWERLTQAPDEGEGRDAFLQRLREGRTGLMVYAPTHEQAERARDILIRHHAYGLFYLRRWTAERLPDA